MITAENFKNLLLTTGYTECDKIYRKKFANNTEMAVDFQHQKLLYPEAIKGRDRNNTFEQNENFVVFECVGRLLDKGYRPSDIELEKQWHLGHDLKSGRADICVYGTDGKMLLIIECKTAGGEYNNALKDTKADGGQLFSYWQQEASTQWLALYTADFKGDTVYHNMITIRSFDDSQLSEVAKSDPDILLYKNAHTVPDKFRVWEQTYQKECYDDLIFTPDTQPYHIGVRPLRKKDLQDFRPEDKIVNRFEEILRHNNVSDRENAFNRLIALFICKLVDEIQCTDADEVQFQYKKGIDTYESLQDRLQKLHQIGMEKFMREKMFYIAADYAENLFKQYTGQQRKKAIAELNNTIRILKFFSNNDFAFKDVHNEQLFYQNGKILVEVVELFEKYRIVYPVKHQFLGDLFEQLLNKGFKQNEGQFFTPMPITRFIWDALPLTQGADFPKIIDYACGAGHFLIEGIEAINHHYQSRSKDWVGQHVYGIEKDYRLARVCKVSMFMNGASDAHIIFGDGLENYTDKGIENNSFDILVANPPYSVSGFKEHLKLKNNHFDLLKNITPVSGEIEVLFVERIHQLVKSDGLVAVILPCSILTKAGSYEQAREQLFHYFHIKAIVELGNQTFGATGTNTVILFMQKRHEPPKFYDLVSDTVDAIFAQRNLKEWSDNAIFQAYLNTIKMDAATWYDKIKKATKKEYQTQYNKLLYFALTFQERVLIITAPENNTAQKNFLGYEWSNTRGSEGIHITHPGGQMYDADNRNNPDTLAGLIRSAFQNDYRDLPDKESFYHWAYLTDMINWQKDEFDNSLKTTALSQVNIQTKWPLVKLDEVFTCLGKGKHPASFADNGEYPFIISSKKEMKCSNYDFDTELLMIGDGGEANVHYCDCKAAASDHTYIFQSKHDSFLTKFGYYVLENNLNILKQGFTGIAIKNIAKSYITNILLPMPPLDTQQKIVEECSRLDALFSANKNKIEQNNKEIGNYIHNVPIIKSQQLEDIILPITPKAKIQTKQYQNKGKYPIIDQSQQFIAGYSNDESAVNNITEPVIIFGDHTCTFKYVDFPFIQGADGIKILSIKGNDNVKYIYYYLLFNFNTDSKYRRHFSDLKQIIISLPDSVQQQEIVAKIELLEEENKKLSSEQNTIPQQKKAILEKYL